MKTTPKYSPRVEPIPNPLAKIALVGEALGTQELEKGEYFVGPAGRKLDSCLKAAGLDRSSLYITNVIKEKPPKNNIKLFVDWGKKEQFHSPEYLSYREELVSELRGLKNCNLIVVCGNTAIYSLLNLTIPPEARKRRGSIYWSEELNKKVLCILHPAALLYTENRRPPSTVLTNVLYSLLTINDLKLAKKECEFPEYSVPERRMRIAPTFQEALDYLKMCQGEKRVAFDIETVGTYMRCFAVSPNSLDSMCIPLTKNKKDIWNPQQELEIMLELGKILEDPKIEIIIHNAGFDTKQIFRRYGIVTHNHYCTMIAQGIIYPDFGMPKLSLGKDLGTTISLWCEGEPFHKDDGKNLYKDDGKTTGYYSRNDEDEWRYNCKDVLVLHKIRDEQEKELKRQNNRQAFIDQNIQVLPAIFMGEFGQLVDKQGIDEAKPLINNRIAKLTEEFQVHAGPINVNSGPQLMDYFYNVLKVKPFLKRRANGGSTRTLDVKALERIRSGGGNAKKRAIEQAKLLLEIRSLSKLSSTYLNITTTADNRLKYDYNVGGPKTGRYSSDTNLFGEGQNSQNLAGKDYEV